MKILWIIDNKYREIYGLYNLRENLRKKKIKLYLIHKFNWKASVDFFLPSIIVIPNIKKNSCKPILDYAKTKNILVFLHSSEGMFYSDYVQNIKYDLKTVRNIEKVLTWGEWDSKFLKKNNLKNKVIETGILKFDSERKFLGKDKKKRIRNIGIASSLRYTTNYLKSNILYQMFSAVETNQKEKVGLLKIESEYIEFLSKFILRYKKNYNIILKPHPFESIETYRDAFPDIEIIQSRDLRDFFNKIDVVITMHSSIAADAIRFNVPVISSIKCIKWNEELIKLKNFAPNVKTGASSIGLFPSNLSEIDKYLKFKKNKLLKICQKKDLKKIDKLVANTKTLKILEELFYNYSKKIIKKNYFNFYYLLKLIYTELRQEFFRGKRDQLFKFWKISDNNLLKKYRI